MRDSASNRGEIARQLRIHLSNASRLRQEALAQGAAIEVREALRRYQSTRLSETYPDLLASPRFGKAARFFLNDLYGPKTFAGRDAEVERIVPALTRLLPAGALEVIARALELDALSEDLDAAMVRELDTAAIDPQRYRRAYRSAGTRAAREKQIRLIQDIGLGLHRLVQLPLLGATLAMMRTPARLAGLSELHDFLERGYEAFRTMGDPTVFLDTVAERETLLLEQLYGNARARSGACDD